MSRCLRPTCTHGEQKRGRARVESSSHQGGPGVRLRRLTRRRQEKARGGSQPLPTHALDRHWLPACQPRAALLKAAREGRSRAFRVSTEEASHVSKGKLHRGARSVAARSRAVASHRSAGMGVGLRAATAAAAVVGLLLLALNGGRLVSATGMLSTRPHEAAPALSQGARLDQLEAGIAALRHMVGQQLPSMMEQRLGSALVEQRLRQPPRGFPTPRTRLNSSAPPPPPPPPPEYAASRRPSFANDRVLTPDDVLQRVPRGEMAFIALANQAYATLGINWALLLLPVLERAGHPERAVLGARPASSSLASQPVLTRSRSLCARSRARSAFGGRLPRTQAPDDALRAWWSQCFRHPQRRFPMAVWCLPSLWCDESGCDHLAAQGRPPRVPDRRRRGVGRYALRAACEPARG